MATEGAQYISQLDPNRPSDTQDPAGEGDDHLRQEKYVLQQTFAGGTFDGSADVYDMAVQVGPRFLNSLPTTLDNLDADYVSLTTPQNITAEHTLDAGIKLAQGTNIQSDNNAQVIGVGASDEVAIGSGTPVSVQDSTGQPTVNDGVDSSPILTVKNVADLLFPVGSIFLSADDSNPSARFPGTNWSKVADGRFLVGNGIITDKHGHSRTYNSGNDTIGVIKHPLQTTELPAHSHVQRWADAIALTELPGGDTDRAVVDLTGTSANTETTGDGAGHENCPPAFALYVWRRDG